MQNNLKFLVVSFIFLSFFPPISAFAVSDSLFYTPQSYTTGKGPWGVVAARLDASQDTFIDLAVANSKSDSVTILKNNGNGLFTKLGNFPAGSKPTGIFAAKLVGNDNYVDVVVANNVNPGKATVLKNLGNNTFVIHSTLNTGPLPFSVCAADLDLDNDNDLAIANWAAGYTLGSITIYRYNHYTDSFYDSSSYRTTGNPYSIVAAKLLVNPQNQPDDFPELAVAVGAHQTGSIASVNIFRNKGDTTMPLFDTTSTNRLIRQTTSHPYTIYAANLDTDEDIDLVTADGQADKVSVFKNLADTSFGQKETYVIGPGSADPDFAYPWGVFAADLDGDGDKDIATANVHVGNASVLINMNDNPGYFDSLQYYPTGGFEPYAVYAFISGDFGGSSDNSFDLVVTAEDSNFVSVLWNLKPYWVCTGIRGDADNDGDIDATDKDRLTNYIFGQSGWPPCPCNDNRCWLYNCEKFRGDWNGDGSVNISDIYRCNNYLNENFNPGGRFTPLIRDNDTLDHICDPLKPQ